MKTVIRLTESELMSIIENSVRKLLGEDAGAGATNSAGVMQGGGSNPGAGQYDAPAFGGKGGKKNVGGNPYRKKIYEPKSGKGSDVTKAPNSVDMSDTTGPKSRDPKWERV